MILTDREIQIALHTGQITIDPKPGESAFASTSVDLCLGDKAKRWKSAAGVPIRPGQPGFSYLQVADILCHEVEAAPDFILKHSDVLLGWTQEVISLPIQSRLAARVEGKSSLARLGIGIHVTAPTIHAGFQGQIQLEIVNHGPHEIWLSPGMRICQLIFEMTTGTPEKGYQGIFANQRPSQ
ncbi:MAG: dCTP deaminase [Azospirillum sp.]|nr:dCTP deaminase [Azospirillum sp.]